MSELFRRHPINKAGTARAKRGKFLMLTMTYNLVQKGVIHSVTVMGGKKLSVCCSGEQRQCHPGGWAPGRLATGHQCAGSWPKGGGGGGWGWELASSQSSLRCPSTRGLQPSSHGMGPVLPLWFSLDCTEQGLGRQGSDSSPMLTPYRC